MRNRLGGCEIGAAVDEFAAQDARIGVAFTISSQGHLCAAYRYATRWASSSVSQMSCFDWSGSWMSHSPCVLRSTRTASSAIDAPGPDFPATSGDIAALLPRTGSARYRRRCA